MPDPKKSIFEFADSPLGENWLMKSDPAELARGFFPGASRIGSGNILVFDKSQNFNSATVKEISALTPDEFIVTIFCADVDTDGSEVLNAYQTYERIASNEIVVFYEVNDNYNLFGSTFRLKLGSEVMKKLTTGRNDATAKEIIRLVQGKLPIPQSRIQEMIGYETDKDKGQIEIGLFFQVIRMSLADLIKMVFDGMAEGVRLLKIDAKRWNADLVPPDEFDPKFIPLYKKLRKMGEAPELVSNTNVLFEGLDKRVYDDSFFVSLFVPDDLLKKIRLRYEQLKKFVKDAAAWVEEAVKQAAKKGLFAATLANAFYCGEFNQLVEVLAELLEGIGYLISLFNKDNWELLLESLENILEEYCKDFFGTLSEQITQLFDSLEQYYNQRYAEEDSPYVIAYNLGEDVIKAVFFFIAAIKAVKTAKTLAQTLKNLRKGAKEKFKELEEKIKMKKKKLDTDNAMNVSRSKFIKLSLLSD